MRISVQIHGKTPIIATDKEQEMLLALSEGDIETAPNLTQLGKKLGVATSTAHDRWHRLKERNNVSFIILVEGGLK